MSIFYSLKYDTFFIYCVLCNIKPKVGSVGFKGAPSVDALWLRWAPDFV